MSYREADRWIALAIGIACAYAASKVAPGVSYALAWASLTVNRLWPYVTKDAP